jgi:hypothetical protein
MTTSKNYQGLSGRESMGRLVACISLWLAYVLPGRTFDAPFYDDVRRFFSDF